MKGKAKKTTVQDKKKQSIQIAQPAKKRFFYTSIIHIIIIILVGFIIYSNTFYVPFLYDDVNFIVKNPAIKDFRFFMDPLQVKNLTNIAPNFKLQFITRIFGNLTFALNYKVHGLTVTGYHFINLIVHILNALLVYSLVRLTFQTPYFSARCKQTDASSPLNVYHTIALFSSLIFVSHPIQTQAITYITQRFASLATMFYISSLVLYVKSRLAVSHTSKSSLYAISLVSAIFAMFTKEIAFTLPVVIALYEFMFFEGNIRKRILSLIPVVATMLVIPIVLSISRDIFRELGSDVEAPIQTLARWDYLFTQFRVILTYIRLLFFPLNQNILYDFPIYHSIFEPAVFVSFLFLFFFIGLNVYLLYLSQRTAVQGRYYLRIISFGIFWFFITLSVESSIIKLDNVIYEHRMYLPSVGAFIAFTTFFIQVKNKLRALIPATEKFAVPILVLIVFILSGMTYARNNAWRNGVVFWEDIVKKSPNIAKAHSNLAKFYEKNNRLDEAMREYEITIRLDPAFTTAYSNLGVIYWKLGRYKDAADQFQTALQLNPKLVEAHINIGVLFDKFGKLQEATMELETALDLDPYDPLVHTNLGVIYAKQRRFKEAEKELLTALKLNPDFPGARKILQGIQEKKKEQGTP